MRTCKKFLGEINIASANKRSIDRAGEQEIWSLWYLTWNLVDSPVENLIQESQEGIQGKSSEYQTIDLLCYDMLTLLIGVIYLGKS